MNARSLLAASALCFGCAASPAESEPALVHLEGTASGEGYRLTLVPAPGARINARLHPVLELEGGRWVQFDQAMLSPDSSYFAAPPEAILDRAGPHLKGILRVGVCPAGLNLCRALQIPIDTTFALGN
jgi:hypothetical protein